MKKLTIVCVDDESEILRNIVHDLKSFESIAEFECCENGEEALQLFDDLKKADAIPALMITDHIMPGMTGAQLLYRMRELPYLKFTKAILLTGQATYDDTIEAINSKRLQAYLGKPWSRQEITAKVTALLCDFIIDAGIDPLPYMKSLDREKLLKHARLDLPE